MKFSSGLVKWWSLELVIHKEPGISGGLQIHYECDVVLLTCSLTILLQFISVCFIFSPPVQVTVDPRMFRGLESVPDAVEYLHSGKSIGKVLKTYFLYIYSVIIWITGEMIDGCEAWLNMLNLEFQVVVQVSYETPSSRLWLCWMPFKVSTQICWEHYNKVEQHICIV